jgi:hypothetical protein
MNHNAVYALYPNAVKVIDDVAYDSAGNVISVDLTLINEWTDPESYKHQRAYEYPSIGDQLDALFHAGAFPEDMAAKIQAVKNAHPKPTLEE